MVSFTKYMKKSSKAVSKAPKKTFKQIVSESKKEAKKYTGSSSKKKKRRSSGKSSAQIVAIQEAARKAEIQRQQQIISQRKAKEKYEKKTHMQKLAAETKRKGEAYAKQQRREQEDKRRWEEAKKKLTKIEGRKDLTILEKNQAKRKVLGLVSGISETQIRKRQIFKLSKQAKKDLSKQLNVNINSIENKALTGQSLTPKEKREFVALKQAQGDKLEGEQYEIAKTIISAPVNYGKNLRIRFEAGENNPLFNDIKKFGVGAFKEVKEYADFGKLIVKIPVKAVSGSYNYGKSLGKNLVEGDKKKLIRDIKNITKGTGKGIINTYNKGGDVLSYVAKNPVKTSMILTAAAEKGFKFVKNSIQKNPAEFLGRATVFVFGGAVVGKATKTISTAKYLGKVQKVINKGIKTFNKGLGGKVFNRLLGNVVQDYTTKYNYIQNLKTGTVKIILKTKGQLKNLNKFESVTTLRLNPKTKTLVGSITTKTRKGKKIITAKQNINLIQKAGFFLDKKTGLKIPIDFLDLKNIKVTKKIKTLGTLADARIVNVKGTDVVAGTRKVATTKILEHEGKKIVKTKQALVSLAQSQNRKIKHLDDYMTVKRAGDVKTILKKPSKKLNKIDFDKLNQFLDVMNYDENIIAGLDKRGRVARALGLNKADAAAFVRKADKLIKHDGTIISFTGKRTASGIISKTPVKTFGFGPAFALQNPTLLQKAKKTERGVKLGQTFSIPKLKSQIHIPKSLPGIKLSGNLFKTATRFGLAFAYSFRGVDIATKIKTGTLTATKTDLKRALALGNITRTQFKNLVKTKVKTITKTKTKLKQASVSKAIPKLSLKSKTKAPTQPQPTIPKLKKIIPVEIKKIPKFLLYWGEEEANKGFRRSFTMVYKKKGKIIKEKTNLPLNKAANKLMRLVDTTLVRSKAKLIPTGNTKTRDIKLNKALAKKFKLRKTPQALEFVEKSKHALDTPQEKRLMARARKQKRKLKRA